MSISEQYNNFIKFLTETYDKSTLNLLMAFFIVAAIVIILRIIVTSGYQAQYIIFSVKSKKSRHENIEIEKEDLSEPKDEGEKDSKKEKTKPSKLGLVSKVLNDYRKSVEYGVSDINTEAIVKKNVLKLNFLGWAYSGMERFILAFEQGIILIGILLTVFSDNKEVFTYATISIFIVFKIISSICDFNLVKEKLCCELIEYTEREFADVGNLDINASIAKFSREVYTGIMKQSDIIKDSIDKMCSNLTGALALSVSEMTKAVEISINKASHFTDELEKPLQNWVESINSAGEAQEKVNIALSSLNEAVHSFNESSKLLSGNFDAYTERTENNSDNIKHNINILVSTIQELKEFNEKNKVDYETVDKQLNYIDKNQSLLEQSLQQYEVTLEGITTKIGDALASIVEIQMHNSSNQLNELLSESMNKVNSSNNEILIRLNELFDTLHEQIKNQTQTIVRVKEQMDMQFDIIREKI